MFPDVKKDFDIVAQAARAVNANGETHDAIKAALQRLQQVLFQPKDEQPKEQK